MEKEKKKFFEDVHTLANEILSKVKPKKEKCMHCFGELADPVFCNKVKDHKGDHSTRIYWES